MVSSSSLDDSVLSTTSTIVPPPYQPYYHCLFDRQVPEGRCVGLQLVPVPDPHPHSIVRSNALFSTAKHWLYDFLHPEEIQYGLQLHHENHRQSFWIGRLAIRHALQQQPLSSTAAFDASLPLSFYTSQPNSGDTANGGNNMIRNSILKDMYGRPQLPEGILGSISHKGPTGVALVRRMDGAGHAALEDVSVPHPMGIGVDLEDVTNAHQRRNVARKVLTPEETTQLGTLAPDVSMEEEILLRFSLKESVYKAMHPLICQYVSFQEAEIQPHTNGTATVELRLKSGAHKAFATPIVAHWYRHENFFVTTASVQINGT
jgi:phosphopantetheine--protein transferase-like protein